MSLTADKTYALGMDHPLSLAEWDELLPLVEASDDAGRKARFGISEMHDVWVVHDTAPVPAIVGIVGPGGRATV